MDWVKPKHRARQVKKADTNESASASEWLKQLCDENVALLQASLPMSPANAKTKPQDIAIDRYLKAMLWGTGCWEVASPNHAEFLYDLVESFGTPAHLSASKPTRSKSTRSKGRKASNVPTELQAHQVTHATNIGKWISQQLPKNGYDPYVALTCAGWLHALPEVGRGISPSLWLDVLQCTLTQVDRAWSSTPEDGLFPWIIWACEAPLALAKQLSHLGGKDRIVSETLNRIALVLEQTSEDLRPLLAFGAQDLRAVVASMVRSRWSADAVGARKWYPPQRKALSKLATTVLHLTDRDGKSLIANASDSSYDPDMWTAIIELCGGNKKLENAVAVAMPDEVGKAIGLKASKLRRDRTLDAMLPKSSQYWDKASVACMRSTWRNPGSRVCVDFSSDVIWLDVLDAKGERILSGDWDVEVKRNGEVVPVDVAWQEVCWFSDDDVDYLELESDIEGVCTIQRQLLLVKEDGVILMADAIVSDSEEQWTAKGTWKTGTDVAFIPETKSTEAKLTVFQGEEERTAALLLPVGLPEWRRSTTNASLSANGNTISLEVSAKARRVYNPLVLALQGLDRAPAYTWRQLTVAEDLVNQPRDIAGAYRVQVGRDQWVFYRSLTPCRRRTVMGLHLNTEFYAARFQSRDGAFEALIEVNPE